MKENLFKLTETEEEIINYKIVIALFDSMYKENNITKKEYDSLISLVKRTFNFI